MNSQQAGERKFVVLDASIWVSRLVPQDEFHAAVRSWMEEQVEAGLQFISPTYCFPEVGGAISRRTGDPVLGRQATLSWRTCQGCGWSRWIMNLSTMRLSWLQNLGLRGADSRVCGSCQPVAPASNHLGCRSARTRPEKGVDPIHLILVFSIVNSPVLRGKRRQRRVLAL